MQSARPSDARFPDQVHALNTFSAFLAAFPEMDIHAILIFPLKVNTCWGVELAGAPLRKAKGK